MLILKHSAAAKGLRAYSVAMVVAGALVGSADLRAAAPDDDCRFAVGWRQLMQAHAHSESVGENCQAQPKDAIQLKCLLALFAADWTHGDEGKLVFAMEPRATDTGIPILSIVDRTKVVIQDVTRQAASAGRYENSWVLRTSPHKDTRIRVCTSAVVWVEIAPERPRLQMDEYINELPPGGNLELSLAPQKFVVPTHVLQVVAAGARDSSQDGLIIDQWPKQGQWLEPWQDIVLKVQTTAPPPAQPCPPSELPPVTNEVAAGAGAAVAGASLVMIANRLRRRRSEPQPPSATTISSPPPDPGAVLVRLRMRGD